MKNNTNKDKGVLFHYTSIETLLKIIDINNHNKICFRASHAKFFNDPDEYKLAVSFLKNSMIQYEKENNIVNGQSSNFNIESLLRLAAAPGEPFMLSFSENSDDLTMWRTYGADGKGVAIGLDRGLLDAYSKDEKNENTFLLECQYEKKKILNTLKDHWKDSYKKVTFSNDGNEIGLNSIKFILDLISFSFSFKRNEYSSEKEWRLCKNEFRKLNIKFREKNGLAVPFIEHYFDKEIIKKIVVGPCVNKTLTKESIEILLNSRNFKLPQKSIIVSKVPYQQI